MPAERQRPHSIKPGECRPKGKYLTQSLGVKAAAAEVASAEVASAAHLLDLPEECQKLTTSREVESKTNLLPLHSGQLLRVDQGVALIREVLSRLLKRVAFHGECGSWIASSQS